MGDMTSQDGHQDSTVLHRSSQRAEGHVHSLVGKGGQQSVRTPPWGCRKMAPNARIHVKFCMEGTFVSLF